MDLTDVKAFAKEQLENAKNFSTQIQFSIGGDRRKIIENRATELKASMGDDDELASLEVGEGIAAWACIASVDLRNSTSLADELGPRQTYLMTHTLLPTLAHVCEQQNGSVMNFRGDGLFASFGLKKKTKLSPRGPTEHDMEQANREAVVCGLALIEATTDAVQIVLSDADIEAELSVGVGIDCGDIVLTRVGWMSANELTAYGRAVNHACKLSSGDNQVLIGEQVESNYPSGPNGKMRLASVGNGYLASSSMYMLKRG